jgi:hypothetical protein
LVEISHTSHIGHSSHTLRRAFAQIPNAPTAAG